MLINIIDHPSHAAVGYWMAGGLWGFYNKRNRVLARYFFGVITSRFISFWYSFYKTVKGQDQYLLNWYFWSKAKLNATIHDAYTCREFNDGSRPFPTQRPLGLNCFVGSTGCCQVDNKTQSAVCPEECRPIGNKKNWIHC